MISGIIKVEVSVISRSRIVLLYIVLKKITTNALSQRSQFIFQTLKNVQLSDKQIFTVFIKQSSVEKLNAFLKKVSLKKTVDYQTDECFTSLSGNLTLLLEIIHCARNLQIIH